MKLQMASSFVLSRPPANYRPSFVFIGALLVLTAGWSYTSPAAEADSDRKLLVSNARSNGVYQVGEKVGWRVEPKGSSVDSVDYTLKKGDFSVLRKASLELKPGGTTVEASLDQPGTLLLDVQPAGFGGKSQRALGGAVIAPEKIAPSLPRPGDFDRFWQEKLKELSKVPANPQLAAMDSGNAQVDYWQITMDNIRGSKIRGQLARPKAAGKLPAMLVVQWAGVYGLPKAWATDRAAPGWLVLNINAHDLPIDQPADFYEKENKGALKDYVSIGNQDRESSYFLRMYLSCYRGAQYLVEREDWNGQTLLVTGTSQGGMQTLMTAGLHPRVTAAIALVPAGCDLTGAVAGRKPGWPAYYWTVQGKDPAKVIDASRYYDVVNFAYNIKCPVLVGVGLVDEVCAPAGIFAALNQVQGSKEIVFLTDADHQGTHNTHQTFYLRSSAWLEALRQGKAAPAQTASP
jgi:cephalosporin-C deacetylase-like acetyl esterase